MGHPWVSHPSSTCVSFSGAHISFQGSLPFVCYLRFMEEIRLSRRQVIVQGASSTFSYPLSALSRCSYVLCILSQFVSYLLLVIREVRAGLQCSVLLLPSIICFLERPQSPQQMPAAPSCCGCSGLTWGRAIPRAVAAVQPWVMNATAQAAPHPAGRCAKGRLCSGVGKSGWRCPSTWHRAGAILEGSELSWGRSPNLPMVSGSGCDESPGPRLMPALLIKMINKSRGKILGVLALFLVMVWYSIYREDSFYFPVQENKTVCPIGEVERKAAQLIGNYTRDRPLFLQLKDYFWVRTPSLYELPYGTKGSEDVLLRLLSVTSYPLPESIQSLKCRRCVVVGNGHRLRNSSMGDTINTYDVVIRLNNAPVHGYEQDVGSKTTMRLFYPESAHFDPQAENNPDTLLVLVPFKPMDFQWMEAILNDKKRVRKGFWKQPPLIWDANPEQVRILNPYYMEVTAAKLLSLPMKQPRKVKQKPTTGLLAITLALHFCDLVHIAGFGYPDSANKKQTIHYYEQITLKSMAASEHNISHEAVAIKRMLELGLVKNLTYF
ncbi:CMP-N-acetylneuraminate-beta-galactosamide-alpha-2,3-sialyltransferase 4 isoform X1 [Tympanuchus pallidicinctus]|uniref:CMP-N-acetylneuraminate-beta-galactosamide- alpha-2,3-sialyltransferase 4 isoform X1 n=1 Tax=Tympanuchus pallidicinctus TaxID=109042 RepID=UPI002286DE33|nr:CMP-N-acetylneuraminate-beta-galactosamide-alpha-2,3-sialyltransferase 4 isoform X1 [Tympanuchus pallidicinctus]